MEIQSAQTLVIVIASCAFFLWLMGIQYLRMTTWQDRQAHDWAKQDFTDPQISNWHAIHGTTDVAGKPNDLLDKATLLLAREGNSFFGPVKIDGKTAQELRFTMVGSSNYQNQQVNLFRHAVLRFTSLGGDSTQIDYAVDLSPVRNFLRIAIVIQALGLILLVGLTYLLYQYVASSADLAIRWQSFQMFQVIHVLWPPFLLIGLYRRYRQEIINRFDAFAHNLPYQE